MKLNYYYSRRPRNRLRKKKTGTVLTPYKNVYPRYNSLRVYHSSFTNRQRHGDPLWGGLHRAWVGYVVAKSQCDCEKMRKYAIVIQKFQRLLNLEISKFPDLGLYTMDAFENKEEDDDSNLAIIDPLTNEKIKEAEEDEDDYVKG
ncbi:MAG TPA: hypothetical protein VFR94_26420 [Nitrososphaeraceae archaeon]|nr:hypothetical protein [Nitrososphaeraceae archaeon]